MSYGFKILYIVIIAAVRNQLDCAKYINFSLLKIAFLNRKSNTLENKFFIFY